MNYNQDLEPHFDVWRKRIETLISEHPLQIISWEATRRCNLHCLHCGTPTEGVDNAYELASEEIIGAFNEIARDFDMNQFRHINVTGGEPFVRDDLLDILKAISRWPCYRNIDIQTNGVFIADNPNILNELQPIGVTGLGISIDGFELTHDSLRGMSGAWTKAVEAACFAVNAGYVVTVSFVAHSKNIHELSTFHSFVTNEIRPRVFRVMFIDDQGRAHANNELLLSNSQIREVIDFLKIQYEQSCSLYSDPSTTMVELGCGGWLGTEFEGRVRPFIFHCIAGLNNLGILCDGKLGSCNNISRHFIEGDCRRERIRDVWRDRYQRYRNSAWKKTGACLTCDQWCFCHGGPLHMRGAGSSKQECIFLRARMASQCVPGMLIEGIAHDK